jgi:tol-pal system protein YbgF
MRISGIVFVLGFLLCAPASAQLDLDSAKKKCVDLGFKSGTEQFGKCVLQLSKVEEAKAATAPPVSAAVEATDISANEDRDYTAALLKRRIGNFKGAITAFQSFLGQYPKSKLGPRAQYWIGDSYFNTGDYKTTIASHQKLIATYPDSESAPYAMLQTASAQSQLGETAVARKTLEALVQRFPYSEAADKAKRRNPD